MARHSKISLLFFVGLGIAILALIGLDRLDGSLAGWGDGAAGRSAAAGMFSSVFALLVCSYFLVSAIGVLIAKSRAALVLVAGVSHSLLLTAYLMIAFQGRGGSTFFMGMALVGAVALVLLSPWLVLWRYVLHTAQRGA
jgi:hypothetical protein